MGCNEGTLSSTCQIVEFLLYGDFAVPLFSLICRNWLSPRIFYGSEWQDSSSSTVPAVTDSLKSTNGLNFDYQDEASAQAAIKDEKIKGYLTIDQEDSVLKAVYHGETSLESAIKLGVTSKLNELKINSIVRQPICHKNRKNAWNKQLTLRRKLMNPRK